jgi:polysaccharide biosynthesis protein PslF
VRDSDSLVFLNQRDLEQLTVLVPDLPKKALLAPPPPIMPVSPPLNDEEAGAVRAQYGMSTRDLVLAFYGYVYPGKGIETLLAAVQKVVQQNRNVGLFLAGGSPEPKSLERAGHPDYLQELQALAGSIAERLCWIGYSQPNSDVPSKILRACDICVLPFDQGVMLNNSSFSFAAMHGIPIITTKGDHTESAFVHEQNALLLEPRNAALLAQEILRLADDPYRRQRLSAGALALAHDRFNWEKTVRATIQFWNELQKRDSLSIA